MIVIDQITAALAGRYAVEREIGAGGMATVFLARDVRHDRHVALKVLNPELGAVLGVERFLAEIKVTAHLQHPNLLPLFDSGEATAPNGAAGSGLLFYVMPFVEGESLRALLDRAKQLPVEEAVRITAAIASALDYAHRHGVIHRDLKPENILLQEGQPLVADFGIALAVSKAGGNRITQTGLSLGTPAYMSPEQATGDRSIDGRTDIYSLGAILYEMLVGEPPHTGATAQAVIAKVITDRPRSIRLGRDTVPDHVEHAVDRALAKLPADRYPTARAFIDGLEGRSRSTSVHSVPSAARTVGSRKWLVPALAIALVAVTTAAVVQWRELSGRTAAPVVRFPFMENATNGVGIINFAFADDGRTFAYVARGADSLLRVYVRGLGDLHPRALAGTEEGNWPSFSPSGEWLVFVAQGQVKKIRLSGGAPIVLATQVTNTRGLDWLSEDSLVGSFGGSLGVLSANGGALRRMPNDSGSGPPTSRWYPLSLGDGEHIVYANWRGSLSSSTLSIFSRRTGRVDSLRVPGGYPVGVADGRLVYLDELRGLAAIGIDPDAGRFEGESERLVTDIVMEVGAAAMSPTGALVYRPIGALHDLVLRRDGRDSVLSREPGLYDSPRMSRDGKRIVFQKLSLGRSDIHVLTIASGAARQLTSEGGQNSRPEWTPDGEVLYQSNRTGPFALWKQSAGAGGPAKVLLGFPDRDIWQGMISHDGRYLAYRTGTLLGADIWYRRLGGDSTERPLAATKSTEQSPRFSPDGKWVAYSSGGGSQSEVYVSPFPSLASRHQVSDGGRDPMWAPDGRALYYSAGGTRIVRATLDIKGEFGVTRIDTVLSQRVLLTSGHSSFQPLPGGGILYVRPRQTESPAIVVTDWRGELRGTGPSR